MGKGLLRAIDYKTTKIVGNTRTLGKFLGRRPTTDTDLAITGCRRNRPAVRSGDGKVVWHENIGRMGGAPATVELDGKQYLLLTGGN